MAIPTPTDIHIGNQLRAIRAALGLTQDNIGAIINVSFQQVQKYERGTNGIGANNLYLLAQGLKVPMEFFFEGLENTLAEDNTLPMKINLSEQDQELLHYFEKIPNKVFKNALIALVKAMANDDVFIKAA